MKGIQKKMVYPFLLLLGLPWMLFGQRKPVAVLEYFDPPEGIEIMDAEGYRVVEVYMGLQLSEGERIRTTNSTAELRLLPNGSIIKLSRNTDFRIEALEGSKSKDTNAFTLAAGKIRTVAAKKLGSQYEVRTPSAVCGVRGTDFGMEVVPGAREGVAVLEGAVEFSKTTGEKILIGAGQAADVFAPVFQPLTLTASQMQALFQDLTFNKLDPRQVPVEAPAPRAETPPPSPSVERKEEPPKAGPFDFLKDRLAMEAGSVTLNQQTYSRLILQPTFSIGKLNAALYLPIIYSGDLFNPDDYFKPKGNNEWSFGTDKNWNKEPQEGVRDLLRDLALKIQYIEYGSLRDPFFFKLGNIHNITLGHGALVREYANDTEFPALRRIGVNLGIDVGLAGIEALTADLAEPEIFATRLYLRPFYPLRWALGLSLAMDTNPAGDLPSTLGSIPVSPVIAAVDPMPVTFSLDVDIPIIEGDFLSFVLFADVAGFVPYLPNEYPASTLGTRGFITKAFFNPETLRVRNYGLLGGFLGNLSLFTYRLEYRQYQGIFRIGYFDSLYDRNRPLEAKKILDFLANPQDPAYDKETLGIYGEGGFTLFKKLSFKAGYFWPWELEGSTIKTSDNDQLDLTLTLDKGLVPIYPFRGMRLSLLYRRTQFVPTLLHGKSKDLELFDGNTLFKGEIVYPIAQGLDLAVSVTTTVERDSSGSIVYEADGKPSRTTFIGIETRIHF
ncbi:MAG: FecR family protein [Spirochaetales bacterium]